MYYGHVLYDNTLAGKPGFRLQLFTHLNVARDSGNFDTAGGPCVLRLPIQQENVVLKWKNFHNESIREWCC